MKRQVNRGVFEGLFSKRSKNVQRTGKKWHSVKKNVHGASELALAKEEGFELADEQLDTISVGNWYERSGYCPLGKKF